MIIDISNSRFKDIMGDNELSLPIRWDGSDFSETLSILFDQYKNKLKASGNINGCGSLIKVDIELVEKICKLIIKAVDSQLNGFPSSAYYYFTRAMNLLMDSPLRLYEKTPWELFNEEIGIKPSKKLDLYRAVGVDDNKPYDRTRVFHTPFNLRSKVSTSRYSIAGYPSLYLGTSLELCCEEIHRDPYQNLTLASGFKFAGSSIYNNEYSNIEVIELGIKPQDFNEAENRRDNGRQISANVLNDIDTKRKYLLWYPLIAACSYIRTYKNDPFAPEYIIPQLLMQWARRKFKNKTTWGRIIGIRYFSCSSVRASDMGFNYVFPTSGEWLSYNDLPYCLILSDAFRLTKPVYIHEYATSRECENALKNSTDFEHLK